MKLVNNSPTQTRILMMLSDGEPHTKLELKTCLPDDLASVFTVRHHICKLRKHLRPGGHDILTEFRRNVVHYRLVRLLASPYEE